MTDPTLSRRTFLAAGGSLFAAAATASWAGPAGATVPAKSKALSALVLSTDLYPSPAPQRFVFAIAKGAKYASGPPARVAFVPPGGKEGTVLETSLFKQGLPKGRGIYVANATFDQPGVWRAVALTQGKQLSFAVQVKPAAEAPIVGAAAPRVASPTTTNHLGVKPICTRKPACPLHTVSLADVVGTGKPVAALFATPALCQSQYCGPVLDELLAAMTPYQSAVTFVHVEIYTSNRGATLAPTVQAWGLPGEPFLYTIDGGGTIKSRLDGAIGKQEIVRELERAGGLTEGSRERAHRIAVGPSTFVVRAVSDAWSPSSPRASRSGSRPRPCAGRTWRPPSPSSLRGRRPS